MAAFVTAVVILWRVGGVTGEECPEISELHKVSEQICVRAWGNYMSTRRGEGSGPPGSAPACMLSLVSGVLPGGPPPVNF